MIRRFRRFLSPSLAIVALAAIAQTNALAAAPTDPPATSEALRREILAMDARLNDAYASCEARRFRDVFSADAELIFGERGRLRGVAAHADDLRRDGCAIRRESAAAEQRIEAVPGHLGGIDGAIQIGEQRFCARASTVCDGVSSKFVALWRRTPDGWRIARLIRYAYAPTR